MKQRLIDYFEDYTALDSLRDEFRALRNGAAAVVLATVLFASITAAGGADAIGEPFGVVAAPAMAFFVLAVTVPHAGRAVVGSAVNIWDRRGGESC